MKAITKGPEPASLTAHRQTPHCDYDNYAPKNELRNALATEQRGLCCYCMGRIRPEPASMKIEHWRCQTHYSNEQLDYRNLLGACLGGIGNRFTSSTAIPEKEIGNFSGTPPIRPITWKPVFSTS